LKGTRDLAVIGGGPGGLVIASVAAQQGLKVTLVEKSERLGGDCLHTGCVPSKTLIRSAQVAHLMRNGPKYGLPAVEPEIDMQRVMGRVDDVIGHIQQHDDPERFRSYGCEVLFAAARFASPHEITVGDDTLKARRLVIATGSRPAIPPIPGIEAAGFDTNETIFKRHELPPRLAVIGSGPVGVELAQAFSRLGSQVTLLERNERVYPVADPDVSDCLASVLQAEGISLRAGVEITSARRDGDSRQLQLSDGATVECDRLLVATGRRPDVSGLGLDVAGVEHTPTGITVDRRLRTSQRHILAVGDVCGPWQFTHMAEYQAGIVLAGLLFRVPRKVNYRVVPRVTYTDPEIAEVGLNETAAREQGLRYDVARFPLRDIDRAVTDSAGEGFIKILLLKGRIAGASLIGAHAGELIHELALAMQVNAKARAVTDLVHAYPTYAQIHRRAVNARYSDLFYSGKVRFLVRLINKLIP
jgi:pyruvate/2-oxoglutarate dehydrogenase complex dihydrolipoamide dehydrogenase (E3) component